MVIFCVSFGSLWWLRPGYRASDPLQFSFRAALFNTTGFRSGSHEHRRWHVPGVIRINAGMHSGRTRAEDFIGRSFNSSPIERRGEWNRMLLGRAIGRETPADKLLLCVHSLTIGRIDFDTGWCGKGIDVVAASAHRGIQETLLLASLNAEIRSTLGTWEVTWNGFRLRMPS